MTTDPNIELALLALREAIANLRIIQKNEMTVAEFRQWSPTVVADVNKATDYLRRCKESLRRESEVLKQIKK
jgi:hypothetical protein